MGLAAISSGQSGKAPLKATFKQRPGDEGVTCLLYALAYFMRFIEMNSCKQHCGPKSRCYCYPHFRERFA